MSAPIAPRVGRLERFLWFAVAALIAGVWLFFEMIAGYEIPTRAHPILALLVLAALVSGGIDLSKVWRYRRLVEELPLSAEIRRELAARMAHLEASDPELFAAIRGDAPVPAPLAVPSAPAAPKPRKPRTRANKAVPAEERPDEPFAE